MQLITPARTAWKPVESAGASEVTPVPCSRCHSSQLNPLHLFYFCFLIWCSWLVDCGIENRTATYHPAWKHQTPPSRLSHPFLFFSLVFPFAPTVESDALLRQMCKCGWNSATIMMCIHWRACSFYFILTRMWFQKKVLHTVHFEVTGTKMAVSPVVRNVIW